MKVGKEARPQGGLELLGNVTQFSKSVEHRGAGNVTWAAMPAKITARCEAWKVPVVFDHGSSQHVGVKFRVMTNATNLRRGR